MTTTTTTELVTTLANQQQQPQHHHQPHHTSTSSKDNETFNNNSYLQQQLLLHQQTQLQHSLENSSLLTSSSSSAAAAANSLLIEEARNSSDTTTLIEMVPVAGGSVENLPCFRDLIAVLFECILIISLGYLSARFKLTTTQAKDLNAYITNFPLPMIIFLNIAQMEFQTINLSFLFCMLSAKLLVFTLVSLLTLTISYPKNFGYAGALSILATQSNDFALGYPLIKSLYGDSNQEMLNYLSLMAPIQLLILNPLGIVMLEYDKTKKLELQRQKSQLQLQQQHQSSPASLCCYASGEESMSCKKCRATGHNQQPQPPDEPQAPARSSISSALLPAARQQPKAGTSTGEGRDYWPSPPPPQAALEHADSSQLFSKQQDTANAVLMSSLAFRPSAAARFIMNSPGQQQLAYSAPPVELFEQQAIGAPDAKIRTISSKNIKSLTLAIPARDSVITSESEDSIHSLSDDFLSIENKLVFDAIPIKSHLQQQQQQERAVRGRLSSPRREGLMPTNLMLADGSSSSLTHRRPIHHLARNRSKSPAGGCSCRAAREAKAAAVHSSTTTNQTLSKLNLNFLIALATNPLIIASVLALLVNLFHGPELPKFVTRVSNTIAASFAAPALFVVGISMYGKFELLLSNPNDLLLASVLVLSKVLLLPTLMRTLALLILPRYTPIAEIPYLIDFSFLYGLLPTAPTACIIANQYGVLSNVVSISMLLSTITSAPLMLVASIIINPASMIKPALLDSVIAQTMKISSVLTFLLASLTLYAFWKANKRLRYTNFIDNLENGVSHARGTIGSKLKTTSPTQIFLLLLTLSQVFIGLGGLVYYFVDTSQSEALVGPPTATTSDRGSINEKFAIDSNLANLLTNSSSDSNSDSLLLAGAAGLASEAPASALSSSSLAINQLLTEPPQLPSPESLWPDRLANSVSTTPKPHNSVNFGFKILARIQYILASTGLLMARFVTLCIIITIVSIKCRGHLFATRISSLLMKACISLAAMLAVWLVFDSDPLKHLPTEPSIPECASSLYAHFIYNTIFLIVAIPMFALIIRGNNKDKVAAKKRTQENGNGPEPSSDDGHHESIVGGSGGFASEPPTIAKRRFATSTMSLTSDASSALTSNTNVESGSTGGCQTNNFAPEPVVVDRAASALTLSHHQQQSQNFSNNNSAMPNQESADLQPTALDCAKNFECRPGSPFEVARMIEPHMSMLAQYGATQGGAATSLAAGEQQVAAGDNLQQRKRSHHHLDESMVDGIDDLAIVAGADHHRQHNRHPQRQYQHHQQAQPQQQQQQQQQFGHPSRLNMTEVDKYSILIVFMLIDSTLNLMSVAQKLLHNQSFGTYRQIEVINVGLEFGQGLLTFLIYGTKGLFKC